MGAVRRRSISPTLGVACLALAALVLGGCYPLFEKPRVSVRRVDVTSVSFTGVGFNVVFAVDNPNALGLDLATLRYQLTVDGHPFVQGAGDHTLHVPANGSGELQLPVSFKFVELAQALATLFTSKRTVPYTIATRLGFGTPLGIIEVPIDHAGTLPVPALPNISVARAAVAGIDLAGAGVSLTLQVRNPNPFPLPMGALHYALSVNGAPIVSAQTPPSELAANGTLPLVLSARLEFVRVGMGVLRAVQSGSATLALDGSVDLGGYAMPVHLQTQLRP